MKLTSLVVMVAISIALSGCSKDQNKVGKSDQKAAGSSAGNTAGATANSEQEKVVVGYCKALEAGKFDEATSYLSKGATKALAKAGGKSALEEARKKFSQHKGIKDIKIAKANVTGETAMVEFFYEFNDGSRFNDYFPLAKEDGKWKIAP